MPGRRDRANVDFSVHRLLAEWVDIYLVQDRPNGVVSERRNTAAARGAIIQRSVPALGMDHVYYKGGASGDALALLSTSF